MKFRLSIMVVRALMVILFLVEATEIGPGFDREQSPNHRVVALGTPSVDPEPFPWQADDRVKVRYPWLPRAAL